MRALKFTFYSGVGDMAGFNFVSIPFRAALGLEGDPG